ncbi:MAG: extensin family protein, partial [Myxococcales bacterium]|nr:extensin family protein [Myxococcales bacterium]
AAAGKHRSARAGDDAAAERSCLAALDERGVAYVRASRKGIDLGVEIQGPLGGLTFRAYDDQPLVIDCSLAVSLAEAGPYFTALGLTEAIFSSAYSRRNVRGTNKPSKHSFGLAIDVHRMVGADLGTLDVALDYEQGLGDAVDCLGQPLTAGGAVLKTLQCQLVRSGLFYLVLSPDYDDAHHNHFHLEARRWVDRDAVRADEPAIH